MLILENNAIRVTFNQENGAITSIYDKVNSHEFINEQEIEDVFIIETKDGNISKFDSFGYELTKDKLKQKLQLVWHIKTHLILKAVVYLDNNSDELVFNYEINNQSNLTVISVEYPMITHLDVITEEGKEDYLIHSYATGFKIHNPLKNLDQELRYMPYPESFSGPSMQFFSYYGQNRTGLYFASYDAVGHAKWLNIYRNDNQLLTASFIHESEIIGPRQSFCVDYPIVIKLQKGDDWYEAADEYKKWAVQQPWVAKGKLITQGNNDKAKWLLETIGLTTFGINAKHDRSKWLTAYHKVIDTKMFHILGPDWTNKDQNFVNHLPGGLDDWFPSQFNQANLTTITKYQDKFAAFEFDYLFNFEGADGAEGLKAKQVMPEKIKSMDEYHFPFLCPAEDFTRHLHVKRDLQLKKEVNVDAFYYDISANNILKTCHNDQHQHPIGYGKGITLAYEENYRATKKVVIEASQDEYIPLGTEMMNERLLNIIDFYQARAGGRPSAPLEGWKIEHLILSQEAELIPLFDYVYHEYGGIRLDGWGKLSQEIGNLFYHTVAQTYLWGGLYELNYEYSPMEVVEGIVNVADEHYYPFVDTAYELSEERASYIEKFAKIRTGKGNKYLAYGQMMPPIQFEKPTVSLDWYLYNISAHSAEFNSRGEHIVDAVFHSAWIAHDQSIAFFFANVTDQQQEVIIDFKKIDFLQKSKSYQVVISDSIDILEQYKLDYSQVLKFSLDKHSCQMVEIIETNK